MSGYDAVALEEQRALNSDEIEMVSQSRQPVLGQLSDRELSDLVARLRDRRNRARDIGGRQGREARGKAAPAGASPAGGNEGTRAKVHYLNAALDRATAERDHRSSMSERNAGQA